MNDKTNIEIESTTKRKTNFFTKDKICFFVIGLLLGAVIASAAFLIYANVNGNNNSAVGPGNGTPPNMMNGGTPPEMPDGEMPDGGTPPELPDGETPNNQSNSDNNSSDSSSNNSNSSSKTRPERPSSSNSSNNTSTN